MRLVNNLEPSGFRKGEYVGYSDGVWKVIKHGALWRAIHMEGRYWSIEAKTLGEVSDLLRHPEPVHAKAQKLAIKGDTE